MKQLSELSPSVVRVRQGPLATDDTYGMNGHFVLPLSHSTSAMCIISDGSHPAVSWEHVSVHVRYRNLNRRIIFRTPSWDEMCRVKDAFFAPEETVVQYHPAKSDYVNLHPHVLHLWKPIDQDLPKPPIAAV